jgi:hypothetical protein
MLHLMGIECSNQNLSLSVLDLITMQFPLLLLVALCVVAVGIFGTEAPFIPYHFTGCLCYKVWDYKSLLLLCSLNLFKFCILEERGQVTLMFELLCSMCFQNGVRTVVLLPGERKAGVLLDNGRLLLDGYSALFQLGHLSRHDYTW